ncbi:3-oxoacyl-[acyl-carrier-protein] synthase III C-terminal domain-containing protein [Streptomyces sp. NPDC057287]|uniref:3-oxoacyl-[acyl-carrier-protein] synthase III C-terminal domain-containing protein n=1 Tax=Streptomyces sp. NPDC057287 TaxID=3346086 RepID=UPI00363C2DFD
MVRTAEQGAAEAVRTRTQPADRPSPAALGRGTTFADLHRLCLHESNPRMLAEVATGLGAPDETVHTISATVGTLACVSAFTLLEEAFHSHRNTPDAAATVVCALIGDVAGSVAAGHITLRHRKATS